MNPNHSTNKELLVDKLQGALAKFRNERDQLHRSKRLALERCRLIQAEEEALSKTVQALRNKYDDLTASSAKIDAEIGPLEQQVEQETKETQFQHTELLGARAKIKMMTANISETKNTQETTIYKTRQFASRNRTTTAARKNKNTPPLSTREQTEGLKREFDNGIDFMDLLYKCMDHRMIEMEAKIESFQAQARAMEEQVVIYREESNAIPPPGIGSNENSTTTTVA